MLRVTILQDFHQGVFILPLHGLINPHIAKNSQGSPGLFKHMLFPFSNILLFIIGGLFKVHNNKKHSVNALELSKEAIFHL